MGIAKIILIVFGVYLVVIGLASIFTRKIYGMGKSTEKYTEESLKKYSVSWGVSNLLCGAGFIANQLLRKTLFTVGEFEIRTGMVLLVAFLIVDVVIVVCNRKVLVKK